MQVLKEHQTAGDDVMAPGRLILVERDDQFRPFVTWWENLEDGGRYYGHYFADLGSAEVDFKDRVERGW